MKRTHQQDTERGQCFRLRFGQNSFIVTLEISTILGFSFPFRPKKTKHHLLGQLEWKEHKKIKDVVVTAIVGYKMISGN